MPSKWMQSFVKVFVCLLSCLPLTCDIKVSCRLLLQDESKLANLAPVFEKEGYIVEKSQSYLWKIFHKTDSEEISTTVFSHRYPFCDIFLMKEEGGRIVIRDKTGQNTWKQEYYFPYQIENISPQQFGDYQLPCPGGAEEYLVQNYGEEWGEVGSTQVLCHRSVGKMQSVEFTIENTMFQPARPFY